MSSASKKVYFEGHIFHVSENVYEPAEDSFLFAEKLRPRSRDVVIDIGTGSGILGIVAAKRASEVVAVDINPFAVRCAEENAKRNNVTDKICFIQGDLFKPIKRGALFDLILFNAPYLPVENAGASWLEWAWAGGSSGRKAIDQFVLEAPRYLKPDGVILLMQSTLSNVGKTLCNFGKGGLETTVVAKQDVPFFEAIELIRAKYY